MGNFGEKSRFGDRLKKINLFKRKKYDNELEIEDSNKMYNNFIKVVAAIPLMVYENVIIGKLIPAGTGAKEYMDIGYTLEKEFFDDEPSEVLEEKFLD